MLRVIFIRDKIKRNTVKEMERERFFGMKCVLMLCREGEIWRGVLGEIEGGGKKKMNEKNGRSRF